MNILVLSDTHGKLDKAEKLIERVCSFADIDMLIHCGDYLRDAEALAALSGIETVSVPGNGDHCRERDYRIVETPGNRILVIHGHTEDVKHSYMRLLYLAEELECNVVCFGHTHVACNEVYEGIHLINPGSPSRPRDGSNGSCALLVCDEKSTAASIIRY